jgi:hypothetical protein
MKLLLMQSPPASHHFLLLRSEYSTHHFTLFSNNLCSSLSVRDQVHTHTEQYVKLWFCVF